jgi:MFS family permease
LGVIVSTERRRYYLALLLLSNVCASVSWGIVSPTIVANCLQRGSSMLTIGVLTSVWALPFLLAAPVYTRIVGRISAKPALLVGMLADAGAVWLFPLVPYDWAWIVLQILTGAMLGHFSLVTEAWLNLFASERTRARVTSLYGMLPAIGYALGAAIYALVGYRGYAPFLAGSVAMALGVLPVLFIPKKPGDIVLGGEERLRHAFCRAPLLLTTALFAGVLEMVPWSLMQVYAVANQWSTRVAGFALPIFYWGQVLLTYPLGWLADRTPRRSVLLGTSAAAIPCMVAMAFLARSPGIWFVIFNDRGHRYGYLYTGPCDSWPPLPRRKPSQRQRGLPCLLWRRHDHRAADGRRVDGPLWSQRVAHRSRVRKRIHLHLCNRRIGRVATARRRRIVTSAATSVAFTRHSHP